MNPRCQQVVGQTEDRRGFPLDIVCGREAVASVHPGRDREWCACRDHANELELDGCDVERWS